MRQGGKNGMKKRMEEEQRNKDTKELSEADNEESGKIDEHKKGNK